MSSIGLYHLDLWHSIGSAVPNLELIKIFSYFYNRGDQITMVRPQDPLERFNKVFFFKDSKNVLGKEASSKLIIENKTLMGYGFFGKTERLKPEIFNQKLNYKCYDEVSWKLSNKADYPNIVKNSFVRFETEDFTDYKPERPLIYINDENLAAVPQVFDLLQQYKNHTFCPLHSIKINDENIEQFMRYDDLIRGIYSCNDYSPDLFREYHSNKKIVFNLSQHSRETEMHYAKRLMVMGLMFKNKKVTPRPLAGITKKGMTEKISNWILKNDQRSFMAYYSDDKEVQKMIVNAPSEIRLLYKTNPLTITSSTFDLKEYF